MPGMTIHDSPNVFMGQLMQAFLLSSITCATLLIATCLELACNEASLYVMYKYPLPKMQSQAI